MFHFKRFSVAHSRSSMKVGVDAVLLGAWGNVDGCRGLDVGCGCGVIALMAAQRNPEARIVAIDIDADSTGEATSNFRESLFADRLEARFCDIRDFSREEGNRGQYDFILSNPPFFDSGKKVISTARERARHEDSLSPAKLLEYAFPMLASGGTLSMITRYEEGELLIDIAENIGYHIADALIIANRPGSRPKRLMLTFRKGNRVASPDSTPVLSSWPILYIRTEIGDYTPSYISLTKPFYLNF